MTSEVAGANPMLAAEVAQELAQKADDIVVLSTGYRAKLKPVSASLIQEVVTRVKYPDVPMWKNPDKDDREEPNPADPEYIRAVQEADNQRGLKAMDAVIMFGIKLIDPVPMPDDPDYDDWMEKLDALGIPFDRENKFHREFAFKKLIATSQTDLTLVMKMSGISNEEVDKAAEAFPGNA